MKVDTKKWKQNFNQELINVQIIYDDFFAERKIDDFFDLHEKDKTGLTIHIFKDKDLPKEIADALSTAFIKSKPDSYNK